MLLTPQKGATRVIQNGGIVGTVTPGVTVPGHATTANTYGTLTEIISSTANNQESWGISITVTSSTITGAAAAEGSLDIYIGGATDDLLISSLLVGYTPAAGAAYSYFFPLHIPQGKRLAAQLSHVQTAINVDVICALYGGSDPPWRTGSRVTTYGTKGNNSRGLTVAPTDSGGTASVTEMTASSTYDHFYFLPGFQPRNDASITPAGHVNIGIGVGAATEERIGTWFFKKSTAEVSLGPLPPMGVFRDVPAATRLTMLASNSGAADTGGYDGHIYAVT